MRVYRVRPRSNRRVEDRPATAGLTKIQDVAVVYQRYELGGIYGKYCRFIRVKMLPGAETKGFRLSSSQELSVLPSIWIDKPWLLVVGT